MTHSAVQAIDAVYTWVDRNDPGFLEALEAARPGGESATVRDVSTINRFRDSGELRYSLRSIARHAPWVRFVHIVTNGQVPDWLDVDNARIRVVAHQTLFAEARCLPTFNSNAIELQLHRIPGLSRRFLYFNDDVFLGRPCTPEHFVHGERGQRIYFQDTPLPVDTGSGPIHDRAYAHTARLMRRHWQSGRARLLPAHCPVLYDKEILARIEAMFADAFVETSRHRFRTSRDLVIRILYLFHQLDNSPDRNFHEAIVLRDPGEEYQLLRLDESPRVVAELERIAQARPRFFCINDEIEHSGDDHVNLCAMRYLLEHLYPHRCEFEASAPSPTAVFQREMWNQRLRHHPGEEGTGSLAYGTQLNRAFHRVRRSVFRRVVRGLCLDPSSLRALDVGTGTGFLLREWLSMGVPDVTGLDLSDVAVRRLREEFAGARILRGDICAVPPEIEGERFDVISVFDVLFHIIDDGEYERAFAVLSSLLTDGGVLIFTENFLREGTLAHESYWKSRSRADIESVIARAGLELVTVRPLFVLMGSPVDTASPTLAARWDRLMRWAAERGVGGVLGAVLLPFELLLVRLIARGPSTKVAVCRRTRVPPA